MFGMYAESNTVLNFEYFFFQIIFFFQLLATGDFVVILQTLLPPVMLSISSLYMFCHYGDHLTLRFEDVGDAFYQFSWYYLPLNSQRDLIFVIAAAQKKVYLRGYAGTSCTREIFKRVCIRT